MNIDKKTLTVSRIAEMLGADVVGSGREAICGVNSLSGAVDGEISFVSKSKMQTRAVNSNASAVLCTEPIEGFEGFQLIVKNTDAALIEVLGLFAPEIAVCPGIDPSAVVDESAEIDESASIGPLAVVGPNASVGSGTVIGAGCKIGENSVVGKNCLIDPNVVIYRNCTVGNNCVIQANTTVGSCGFGYSFIDGQHRLVPHNGGVIIEDCVEIGANCCVDRAKFGNTIIGAGTKIDDLVMIGHNVHIGKLCLIVAQVGIAGSAEIGNGVVIAGQSGVGDHCTIGDGVKIGAKSKVLRSWKANRNINGNPAVDMNQYMREVISVQRLPGLAKEFKKLVKRVEELEASKND